MAEEQPAQEEPHGYEQKKMYDERTKEEQNLLEDSKRQEEEEVFNAVLQEYFS